MMYSLLFYVLQENPLPFIDSVGFMITVVTTVAAAVVFIYQQRKQRAEMFSKCTESIHSDNEVNRITSAILLRTYLRQGRFRKDALNVLVALLRVLPNGNVQKTLADGLTQLKSARGQDFQKVNLHDVLIKPKSYIDYELEAKDRYKRFKINMKRADFYESDISESSIHSVDFYRAVFYNTSFFNTSFRNCSFVKADFRSADLNKTRFYECDLDGADFKGAKRISSALVITYENNGGHVTEVKRSLSTYLDEKGIFHSDYTEGRYEEDKSQRYVFVSRLGLMDSMQQMHYDRVISFLETEYGLKFITLERSKYMNHGQLNTIKDQMELCSGVLVFASSYLHVLHGLEHENLSSKDRKTIRNHSYTSPWIQIETAFASSLKLPTLMVLEDGVIHDGIFDDKITEHDSLLHKILYSGGLDSNAMAQISKWYSRIENTTVKADKMGHN